MCFLYHSIHLSNFAVNYLLVTFIIDWRGFFNNFSEAFENRKDSTDRFLQVPIPTNN